MSSGGSADPYDLNRFVQAQEQSYLQALSEIRSGRKRSHWMWYIFPQFDGLGSSATSRHYAIRSLAEADAYLRHPVLGPRLLECAEAALRVESQSAADLFGPPDDMKLRSCATLFARVSPAGSVFERLLDKYFRREPDDRTLRLLSARAKEVGMVRYLCTLVAISSLATLSATSGRAPQPTMATGTTAMVSSAHPLATEAGLEILRAGGNAFDAAIAIAAALNVVEPAMSGAGGYGTILVHHAASKETWFLNPSGRIPAAVNSDAFRAPTPGYRENRRGAKSVSTPGNVNAWEAMSKRYGRTPWSRLFVPAIRLAADGFVVDSRGAGIIESYFDGFPEHARAFYGRNGKPLKAGDRLVQADLARSLGQIASKGAGAFYKGEIARAIDVAMKEADGFLALGDLERDAAEWWKPISMTYRSVEVLTASPPANAFDYLVRLGIMSRFDNPALGHNSVDYLHRFAEATKHGFWVRLRYAGDPDVAAPPVNELLSEEYWREQAAAIDIEKAKPFTPPGTSSGHDGHTTHFVVADREGNVVSATQTLGGPFGARIMPKGTGIWLNDSLEFSTFEPKGNPMDAHAGRRKLSGDCPTILLKDGRPWVAIGTPGGHSIGQTVPQMVMNLVDFGMNVHQAIAAPRISFSEPDVIAVEEGIGLEIRRGLEQRGHKLRGVRALGNAHGLAIEYDPQGRIRGFAGAADPRGTGLARGQ